MELYNAYKWLKDNGTLKITRINNDLVDTKGVIEFTLTFTSHYDDLTVSITGTDIAILIVQLFRNVVFKIDD